MTLGRDAPSDDQRGALSRGQPALLERAPVHPRAVLCRLVPDVVEADDVVSPGGESAGERRERLGIVVGVEMNPRGDRHRHRPL